MLAANLGVIAGIIFLAVEVQQNNDLLDSQNEFLYAQARAERYQTRQSFNRLGIENPLIGETFSKYGNGGNLQPHEISYMLNVLEFNMINWEYLWSEYNAGLLSIAELGVDARRGAWNGFPTE